MRVADANASALQMNGILGGAGSLMSGVSGMNWNF
jgi:hypothetical protein